MAEENAATQRRTSERAQIFLLIENLAGRVLGAGFACLAIGVSAYLALKGHDAVAGIIGGTTVVGVAVALIGSKRA